MTQRSDGAPSEYRAARVSITDHDPGWSRRFAAEAELLAVVLGDVLRAIEHVGSTAVPGLPAKPIVDILVAVDDGVEVPTLVRCLEPVGYLHTPDASAPAHVFRKGPADMAELRTHHLHVTGTGSAYWRRIVAFRDHLRSHPADAATYAELKRGLASDHADDRRSYTRGKHRFVTDIERRAGIEHGPCPDCDDGRSLSLPAPARAQS